MRRRRPACRPRAPCRPHRQTRQYALASCPASGCSRAAGRSSPCCGSRLVTINTIMRTSITSTSCVMLSSFIRPSSSLPAKGSIALGTLRRYWPRAATRQLPCEEDSRDPVTKNAYSSCAKRLRLVTIALFARVSALWPSTGELPRRARAYRKRPPRQVAGMPARQSDAAPAFFTAHSLVTVSPSLNESVSGIDVPTLTGCFGFSSIT